MADKAGPSGPGGKPSDKNADKTKKLTNSGPQEISKPKPKPFRIQVRLPSAPQ